MIYIIILNWNNAESTIRCLKSILILDSIDVRIIVVDNGSSTSDRGILHNYLDLLNSGNIEIIYNQSNLGFGAGMNVGIRYALNMDDSKFIWLLNNDTEVTQSSLNELLKKFELNKNLYLCGSTLVYLDNTSKIAALGGTYNSWLGTTKHIGVNCNIEILDEICKSDFIPDYVVGASLFFTTTALKTIGLISEEYFLYYEELDWIHRLRLISSEAKYEVAYKSIVMHKEGGSTGVSNKSSSSYSYSSDFYKLRSRLIFAKKYYPFKYWVVRFSMFLVFLSRLIKANFLGAKLALFFFLGINLKREYYK